MKSHRDDLRALARNGLIGLEIKVVRSSEKNLEGVEGTILDETLNTITIECRNKVMKMAKNKVSIEVRFPEGKVLFDGKDLVQRPEDRLKKLWRKIR